VNLDTGAATDLGALTGITYSVSGFSVAGDPPILNSVPEPTTMLLLGSGLLGLAGYGRKKFFKKINIQLSKGEGRVIRLCLFCLRR
jgi:hypothetical protein